MGVTLDPGTALIVVDLQKGILGMAPERATAPLVATSARLADAFHEAGLPVVWVHATGLPAGRVTNPVGGRDEEPPAGFTELHDDLPVKEGDHHVAKDRTFSAFPRTGLAEHLRSRGVTQVVLTGIATGAGVESTARSAYDEGLSVTVVSDAVMDPDAERHRASLRHALPGIGTVATAEQVLAALPAR